MGNLWQEEEILKFGKLLQKEGPIFIYIHSNPFPSTASIGEKLSKELGIKFLRVDQGASLWELQSEGVMMEGRLSSSERERLFAFRRPGLVIYHLPRLGVLIPLLWRGGNSRL